MAVTAEVAMVVAHLVEAKEEVVEEATEVVAMVEVAEAAAREKAALVERAD